MWVLEQVIDELLDDPCICKKIVAVVQANLCTIHRKIVRMIVKKHPHLASQLALSAANNIEKIPYHLVKTIFKRISKKEKAKLAATIKKLKISGGLFKNFVKQKVNAPVAASGGSAIPPVPVINFEKFGDVESVELSRIKKISGKHLHACWLNIPHVTQFDEADITELEKFRKENKDSAAKQGVNLTPLVFIMKAVVAGLKLYPELNASLSEDKETLILKNYYNIGVAVDTPNGLMVPVIKDVDKKGFLEIAGELGEISARARDGALTAKDLQGGTFSISSLGGIGGSFFTPIVNAPEVAILGVSRSKIQPVWNGTEFEPRLILPMSLSYDHRVIDGADGARFTSFLNRVLSDTRRLLL